MKGCPDARSPRPTVNLTTAGQYPWGHLKVPTDVRRTSVGRPHGRSYGRPPGVRWTAVGRPTDVRRTFYGRPRDVRTDAHTDVRRTSVGRASDVRQTSDGRPSDVRRTSVRTWKIPKNSRMSSPANFSNASRGGGGLKDFFEDALNAVNAKLNEVGSGFASNDLHTTAPKLQVLMTLPSNLIH